ncbi:armadillo repeat-containing protein 8-like isoform X1 [Diorhabda sublineata]|uniref:armadillo repeat-containing protein 8-like isoform X1 n=1 Tax=Diorhabda sublineata TaxID=1163346 RepID=UPI0024E0DB63|nr:armadillo repeat-containing protein 8-like isoform X1 [Diorhabda sublineata]
MLLEMQVFTAFMNVECTRSYIDDLYSKDPAKCLSSIICIKNSVIGSNRQKESVIAQGIVPKLLSLLRDKDINTNVRIEAAVTIGSLAKGKEEHVELLINSGTSQIILDVLEENDQRLIDPCLCCLRTLSQHPSSSNVKYDVKSLRKLLSFAHPKDSLQRQSCVANILTSACRGPQEQTILSTIGAPAALTTLLSVQNYSVTIPIVTCLATMCLNHPVVAAVLVDTTCKGIKLPDYLGILISRDRPIDMQLGAARCLTNLYRAGALSSCDPIVTYRTLPCLVRLCQIDHQETHRALAAETLAYLTEVDSHLQQVAAISNQLVGALADLLKCPSAAARGAAFKAFASLGANDENIRKRIIDTKCLMDRVVDGLADENKEIRLAAVRCLHSLSRSVQQLRTTFQDHTVWRPLMALLTGMSPDCPSSELLTAASSALCNLLLEFSPAKEPMIQQGVVQLLATMTSHSDPSLRLNGVWALMNLSFQAEQILKSQILTMLGTDQIFRLLADSDTKVLMKTLGLIRNLVSPRIHTDMIMALHGPQIMQGVVMVLEGSHPPDVKEQAICILGNIADGERARDHIMSNEDVLKKLIDYMIHPAPCLQESAVFCINNLARRGEPGVLERQSRLKELGVVNILQQLLSTSDTILFNRVKSVLCLFAEL